MAVAQAATDVSSATIANARPMANWLQIDGSEHRWFEDRGPPCSLLVFVDDATGKLMQLRFVALGKRVHLL